MTTTTVTRAEGESEQRVEIEVEGADAFDRAKAVMTDEFADFPTGEVNTVRVELTTGSTAPTTTANGEGHTCETCGATFETDAQLNGHKSVHTPRDAEAVGSARAEAEREYGQVKAGTVRHEVLTVVSRLDRPDYEDISDAIKTGQPGTSTSSLTMLYEKMLVDREREGGRYVYWITPLGEMELDRMGDHPAQAADDEEVPA